jgi:4-hydroxy-L-threonine phosphate dehydrogenase PdxA
MRAAIGITSGDPAGIGLEVVLKSIPPLLQSARWVLFTDREIFARNVARLHRPIRFQWVDSLDDLTDAPALFLQDLRGDTSSIQWGILQEGAGRRALAYL